MSKAEAYDTSLPLRRMAEERVAGIEQRTGPLDAAEMTKSLHELMVHQVELEIQNEELIATRSELETNAKLLMDLYDFAPVGYLSIGSKGLIRRVNLMGATMLGKERGLLIGEDFSKFLIPQNRRDFENFLSRIFTGDGTQLCEVTLSRQGQPNMLVSLNGGLSPNGIAGRIAITDITERKESMEALRRSEDKFRSIIMSSPTAFYLYQLQNYDRLILVDANAAADKETGVAHAGLIGMTLEEAFPNLTKTEVPKMYRAIAEGELDSQQFEIRYADENGVSGFFEVHAFQTNPGMIGVAFTDISQRRMIQEELEKRVRSRTAELQKRKAELRVLANELNHAEERERDRIALVIHEDLQQMLVAALLNLGMLKTKFTDSEVLREFDHIEQMIRDSVKTARALTAELSPPVLRQSGLIAAFEWLQAWCRGKYGLGVRLDMDHAVNPSTEASVMVFRCVRELLFNTVKYAGVHEAGLRMWLADEGILKIEVSDAGNGFDPELAGQRQDLNGGFGLLSIHKRMEWLGGGLEIESAPGTGSHFTLWFPIKSKNYAESNK